MKFKSENFEATATEVDGAEPRTWVIESPGNATFSVRSAVHHEMTDGSQPHTVALVPHFQFEVLESSGWVPLHCPSKPRTLAKDLATAIAVLYSVPGVECAEEG